VKKTKRTQPVGVREVRGSDAARRLAALVLESWCGVRTTQSASDAIGVALPRFYQLEARALQALVAALEPRPRGRQLTAESELGKLKLEKQRLVREVERYQSLYRISQRALGVTIAKPGAPAKNPAPGGKRKRGPRRKARGQAVATVLLGDASRKRSIEISHGATEQGPGPRGGSGGRSGSQVAAAADPEHAPR
jgi:hypothetical protein